MFRRLGFIALIAMRSVLVYLVGKLQWTVEFVDSLSDRLQNRSNPQQGVSLNASSPDRSNFARLGDTISVRSAEGKLDQVEEPLHHWLSRMRSENPPEHWLRYAESRILQPDKLDIHPPESPDAGRTEGRTTEGRTTIEEIPETKYTRRTGPGFSIPAAPPGSTRLSNQVFRLQKAFAEPALTGPATGTGSNQPSGKHVNEKHVKLWPTHNRLSPQRPPDHRERSKLSESTTGRRPVGDNLPSWSPDEALGSIDHPENRPLPWGDWARGDARSAPEAKSRARSSLERPTGIVAVPVAGLVDTGSRLYQSPSAGGGRPQNNTFQNNTFKESRELVDVAWPDLPEPVVSGVRLEPETAASPGKPEAQGNYSPNEAIATSSDGADLWPALPSIGPMMSPDSDAESEHRARMHIRRLELEQRGILWNESPF